MTKKTMLQSRESRKIFGETETTKIAPRRDQSRGLESRLQALLCIIYYNWGFLVFEIRKNLDLRKILVTPKIFLKSRFHCTTEYMDDP